MPYNRAAELINSLQRDLDSAQKLVDEDPSSSFKSGYLLACKLALGSARIYLIDHGNTIPNIVDTDRASTSLCNDKSNIAEVKGEVAA